MARLLRMIRACLRLRDGIDARHVLVIGDAFDGLYRGQARKAIQVTRGNELFLDVIDVMRDEAVAPIVEDQTETAAGVKRRGEIADLGVKTEVELANGESQPAFAQGANVTAVAAVAAVNAIVQAPAQAVHVAVGHAEGEPLEHHLAHVGLAIAVGVLQENNFRRRSYEEAAVPRADRGRKTQSFGEEDAAIGLAVAIGVFQKADGSAGFALRPEAIGIIAHLHDVTAACLDRKSTRLNSRHGYISYAV